MNATASHHPYGPSKWPAILDCPCFKSDGGGAESELGTKCHEVFASLGRSYCTDHEAHIALREAIGDMPSSDVANKFALKAWDEVADLVEADGGKALDDFIESAAFETAVHCADYFGTCDLYWRSASSSRFEESLHVLDLKTFHNPGRDYTAQLAGYALCLMDEHDERVTVHVVYGEDGKVETQTLTRKQCEELRDEALFKLRFGASGSTPSQCEWCAHCAHKGVCPAQLDVVNIATKPVAVDAIPKWPDLSSAQKAKMMLLAETVSKWAEAIRDAAKQDLMAGSPISSPEDNAAWTLRTTRGRATPRIRDFWALAKANGVGADAVMDAVKISASDATSVLVKATGMKRKEAASLVESVSDRGADSVTMVRTTAEG